jgi:type VI secretion system protein ImpL
MRNVFLGTAITLVSYSILAWFSTSLLGIRGVNVWILQAALLFIGLAIAAIVAWFLYKRAKQKKDPGSEEESAAQAAEGSEEIDVLVREAEARLSAAQLQKGAKIGNLPLILLLGESASAKTTSLINSGLESELLAGQLYKEGAVMSTRAANLWFSRRTLFVEAGGNLLQDTQSWTRLLKRIRPRKLGALVGGSGAQAPRAAVVCMDVERVAAGGDQLASLARSLRARLGEIAQTFDIQLPVYVLFTKTDRIPFFSDFVHNLTKEETTQVLGVTLPSARGLAAGIYAQEQTNQLSFFFDRLFQALCNARPECLSRETDAAKLPGTYEFPREFRKLRASLVQFLVDLCRPSQLTVGPFLRGFYFSGVRPLIVEEVAPAAVRQSQEQERAPNAADATRIFRPGEMESQAARVAQQPVVGTRKVPHWVFLGRLFNDVLLGDRVAMGASESSAKTNLWRRILLASIAALCLVSSIILTVSFFQNRSLETQVKDALRGTAVAPGGASLASVDSLRRLETLRQSVETLSFYRRDGAPLNYRWGLYIGNDLYPEVRRLYFARFHQQLFGDTQDRLLKFLRELPASPGPLYGDTYDTLKAYLITTSHNERSSRDFLSPRLYRTWIANRTIDSERTQLAQKQFDFYSDELLTANPFSKDNDAAAIEKARRYLSQFKGFERVYHRMLMDAANHSQPINFNKRFPAAADVVIDATEVTGPFTKEGWSFMQDAMKNPDRYSGPGEQWVLGEQASGGVERSASLTEQLQQRYESDYIAQWRAYLAGARVVKYQDAKDAASKLTLLSGGNASPLLALFGLASQNTAVDDRLKAAFQPVLAVVPPGDRYLADSNKNYVYSLVALQISVDAYATQPDDDAGAMATLKDAATARIAARQMTAGSVPDPGHVDAIVGKLVLDPITEAERVIRGRVPEELNGNGKALCAQFKSVMGKYPFNPKSSSDATLADVNSIFGKADGALWAFYRDNHLQNLLPKQGNQYVAKTGGAVTLSPGFVEFFNHAAAFSEALYANNPPDPRITYSLKQVATEGVQGLGLEIDGQTFSAASPKPFVWQGSGPHGTKATVNLGGSSDVTWSTSEGLWAVFRFFGKADHRTPTPEGELLEWSIRVGSEVATLNGKPLTLQLELSMAGSPPVFQKGFLSQLACTAEVAK